MRLLLRRRWSTLSLSEVVRRFDTPQLVNRYMQVCFEYVHDDEAHGVEDYWQAPELTHELKSGDCEDFAMFAWHVLSAHRHDSHLFTVFTEEDGHAVCVFRDGRRYHTICNVGLVRRPVRARRSARFPDADAARRLADAIYPEGWECCSFVDRFHLARDDEKRRWQLIPRYDWIHP